MAQIARLDRPLNLALIVHSALTVHLAEAPHLVQAADSDRIATSSSFVNLGRDLNLAATTVLEMCANLVAGPILAAILNLGFTVSSKRGVILDRTPTSTNQPSSVMVVTLGLWLYLLRIALSEMGAILVINV